MNAGGPESAYRDPDAWAQSAALVYRPLAQVLVQRHSPVAFTPGMRVLDVGTGTGLVAEALGGNDGLHVVGVDRSALMLAHRRGVRPPGVQADASLLPFPGGCFDVWVAAFLLNHLPPEPALREAARVVRPGGGVLASTWPADRHDAVKAAIDEVARRSGWAPPRWYREMKRDFDAASGDPGRLAALARRAGLGDVDARIISTALLGLSAAEIVDYRLALPQYGPWRTAASPATLAAVRRQGAAAIEPILGAGGWTLRMVVLTARA